MYIYIYIHMYIYTHTHLCGYPYMIWVCLTMEDLPRQFFFSREKYDQLFFCSLSSNKTAFRIGMGWRVEISELMPVVETCLVTSVLCEESEFVSWQFTGKESRTRYFVLHFEFGVRLSDSFASFHLPADDWCLGTRTIRTNRFLDDI